MRKSIFAAAGAAGLVAAAGFAAPASAAEGDAHLSVLHGVPGLTVDVWVDGALTLDDFAPGTLAGPLPLPAGGYSLAITAADAASADEAVIGPVDVELEANGNYTAVANLDAEGNPTANFYPNDVSTIEAGQGKLTVRHVAAAPEVDVLAGDAPVIEGLANPDEQTLTLDPGTVSAAVAAAGTTDPLIGPADLTVAEGTHTVVYAWGSLEEGTLQLAVQNIEGLHSNPGSVPAGQSGAADNDSSAIALGGMAAAGFLLLGGTAMALRQRAVANRSK